MGCGSCFVLTLRLFQITTAIAVIALGALVASTVNDARQKGDAFLDAMFSDPKKEKLWKDFFDSLLQTPGRVWFSIAAGSWTVIAVTFLAASHRLHLNISRWILICLEFLTAAIMAGAFAAIASLALELEPMCFALDFAAPELLAFFRVCPISKADAISAGFGWALFVLTTTAVLIEVCQARRRKTISFEPTVSGLGMGVHGYQAVPLQVSQSRVPTMYDPFKGRPAVVDGVSEDVEKSRTEVFVQPRGLDTLQVSAPGGKRASHRPWSEISKARPRSGQ